MNNATAATALSPADVLDRAADHLDAHPEQWGRDFYRSTDGCRRCVLGTVAWTVSSERYADGPFDLGDADPTGLAADAAAALSDYLERNGIAYATSDTYDEMVPSPTPRAVFVVGDWNDKVAGSADEVARVMRSCAAELRGGAR